MNERLVLSVPDELVDAIAERVAALLEERREPANASPWLTVREAAELIRAKPQRVYDLLSARRLTRYRDGSRVLVRRDELEAYLAGAIAASAERRAVSPARRRARAARE